MAAFGLTAAYPEANWRHYRFMLEGLGETAAALRQRGIGMAVRPGHPPDVVRALAARAALVVVDGGYLRHQRQWRAAVAATVDCGMLEVESDVVVPVRVVADCAQYAARTLRPRIQRLLDGFLIGTRSVSPRNDGTAFTEGAEWFEDPDRLRERFGLSGGPPPVDWIRGGRRAGLARLRQFIARDLDVFGDRRNDPGVDRLSHLSPYLHFGQVSPREVALAVLRSGSPGTAPFLEELIVRRELSMNLALYNPDYDAYRGLPAWARRTLAAHARDPRPACYTPAELEDARTHDPYWNAAMREMILRGKMHGYMRMYWGKKILEWSASPQQAFETALAFNNRYFLDGRDANSYAGVAWCFGTHDRPWAERPVFGTVRYMNDAGLRRKFDIEAYVRRIPPVPPAHDGAGTSRPQGSA